MKWSLLLPILSALSLGSCYSIRSSSGGGQDVKADKNRSLQPADIKVPVGYKIEVVASDLTFPTGITFDDEGRIYVTESGYSYGEVFLEPKLVRIEKDGSKVTVVTGEKNGPWNGVFHHSGSFYIAEGGQMEGGKIIRITTDGKQQVLVEGLPSLGDHHTNGPVVHNGYIYFGQGVATNSGVPGKDSKEFGWLERHPEFHDIPCKDITLAGVNFMTDDLLGSKQVKDTTGAFLPYGTPSTEGQVIKGALPCSGSVMRVLLSGGPLELVAWGFRNPYGLAFNKEGTLFVTDNGYDDRGSRPVWGAGDLLWKVEEGKWYGWPDYSGHQGIAEDGFSVPGEAAPKKLLQTDPSEPPHAAAVMGVHSSSNGFDISRSAEFGFEGEAIIAQFGDMAPGVGKVLSPVGFKVVRVDTGTGVVRDLVVNRQGSGPASRLDVGGIERPVAVRFSPDGTALYIVDFGIMLTSEEGPQPLERTGVIWKMTKIK